MGYKRSFDAEEFEELAYKQQKQLDYSTKLTLLAGEVPQNHYIQSETSGEGKLNNQLGKSQLSENPEISIKVDNDVESRRFASSTSGEDSLYGRQAFSSLFPEYFEYNFSRNTCVRHEDLYSSFLDRYPRKQVPVSPNHQANVPDWVPHKNDIPETEEEKRLMGICVIPLLGSDLSTQDSGKVGNGKKDCNCLDTGSVRCVRLHVVEAREKLKRNFGLEKFIELGFGEMGEEVARKWAEEEEEVFHEVVFSNPASMGINFWKHFAVELPSRTTRELVSHYFNVFMLRRRAAQNRSTYLDIDSDDDEWHETNERDSVNIAVIREEDDSTMESPFEENDSSSSDDDDDNDNDDDDDDDGGGGDGGMIHMNPTDKCFGEGLGTQDDSCMSFEFPFSMSDSCSPVEEGSAVMQHDDGVRKNTNEFWDGDLLPTFNMIEEFFGPGSWENNTAEDKGVN